MELQILELELAAVSISIAAGCIPCTQYHIAECEKLGAYQTDVVAAVRSGADLREAALSDIRRRFSAGASKTRQPHADMRIDRQGALCGIGSAVANNSVEQLNEYLTRAKALGIGDREMMEVVGLAERIKEKAASHLNPPIAGLNADKAIARSAAKLCT